MAARSRDDEKEEEEEEQEVEEEQDVGLACGVAGNEWRVETRDAGCVVEHGAASPLYHAGHHKPPRTHTLYTLAKPAYWFPGRSDAVR